MKSTPQIDAAITAIKAERGRRMQNGGVLVNGHWYQTDQFSRTQHLQLLAASSQLPQPLSWRTLDDAPVQMDAGIAGTIVSTSLRNDVAIFEAAERHIAALERSEDPSSYDFTAGWPQAFGE